MASEVYNNAHHMDWKHMSVSALRTAGICSGVGLLQ